MTFKDDDDGWDKAEAALNSMTEEKARGVVEPHIEQIKALEN